MNKIEKNRDKTVLLTINISKKDFKRRYSLRGRIGVHIGRLIGLIKLVYEK